MLLFGFTRETPANGLSDGDLPFFAFDDAPDTGSIAACKEKGLVRSEGKDYVMKDGDVTLFRFNV